MQPVELKNQEKLQDLDQFIRKMMVIQYTKDIDIDQITKEGFRNGSFFSFHTAIILI
jgi:hypothetical protein